MVQRHAESRCGTALICQRRHPGLCSWQRGMHALSPALTMRSSCCILQACGDGLRVANDCGVFRACPSLSRAALDAVTPHLCFAAPRIWRQHRDGHSDHEPKQGIRVIRVWRAVAQHFLYSCPSRAKAVLILTAAAIYTLCVAHEHYIAQVRALYRQLGTRHLPARGGTAQGRAS